jgi:hypothetical protein
LDFLLKASPYFMNINGTGIAITATPPRRDMAGPTPKLRNIGLAASGNAAAKMLRRKVFPDTALAAYSWYVSIKKFIHCWKMMLNPAPIKIAAATGAGPIYVVSKVSSQDRVE